MFCQKCRVPLELHASLEDQLSPATFDLLVGSSTLSPKVKQNLSSSKPVERKELYEKAKQTTPPAVFKRVVSAPRFAPPGLQESHYVGGGVDGSPQHSSLTTPARSLYQNPTESFVYLTESQVAVTPTQTHRGAYLGENEQENGNAAVDEEDDLKTSLSHQMEVSAKLFGVLSSKSDIDHPVCMECTELLVDGLSKRLANVTKERDAYVEFLRKVNAEIPTQEEKLQAEKEYQAIKAEEALAIQSLRDIEQEKTDVLEELRRLEEEAKQLDLEEENFWKDRNEFALKLEEFQNDRDSINLQYDHDSRQLERLQRTNVYNDTFCIGHDGYFGTINGLRLGRLPNQPVEWPEINAAWGQTLLLLATVAEKIKFTFEGYRLKPMGSASRIEKVESHHGEQTRVSSLELFSSGDLPLTRMFVHRKFDHAMVAFLDCLRQMGEYVESQDSNVKMPYTINRDKIGDACIRLAFKQDEAWTKACKYTLTCAKFLLAYASNTRALHV
ncbi:APG6-domain-containing protein [Terfezia boudieri ATCC MYA-4762]|uniref:APG6-domain-containing protein n=1 Tax=Terfezia boudieri ATCC MYA-4762 TaxID=1051890 RepID=A0A3N4LEF6_9PEZI|nr:APG6-domain-containing protein [Terfezia boudieri ATCC MYA-4762]